MKTVTVILVIFLVAALTVMAIAAVKALADDPQPEEEDTVVEEIPELQEEEEETSIEPEEDPATEQQIEEEEADPEAISAIEIYLDGPRDEGIMLGDAQFGLTSKEAYSFYGESLSESGFLLAKDDAELEFEPGSMHYLYIYILIPKYGWEYSRNKVMVSGDPGYSENIRLYIDDPEQDSVIKKEDKKSIRISGWSADLTVSENTGIEKIEIYLNGPRGMGKFLGQADYGQERQDVANALANINYVNSGYSLTFDASHLGSGTENTIYVYSFSTGGAYTLAVRDIIMEGDIGDSNIIMSVEASLEESSINVSGWVVSKDAAQNTGPRDTDIEYIDKRIAFVSNKNGNEDIFIMDIDGANLTQLTDSINKDAYPSASPDGKKIAYTSEIGGYWQIFVMDVDGNNKTQLTNDPFRSGYPTWSFDGRHIFYEVYRDGDWEIYRMNSDGSSKKRLTFNSGSYDWHPFAHPFRYELVYESGSTGNERLYLMNEDGSEITKIPGKGMRMRTPTYSPDGSRIAFMGYEGNNHFIYLMDADGQNIERLTSDISKCGHPDYSPDGEYIVFQGIVDGQDEIFIVNSDGSDLRRLTNIPGNDWDACFIYQFP